MCTLTDLCCHVENRGGKRLLPTRERDFCTPRKLCNECGWGRAQHATQRTRTLHSTQRRHAYTTILYTPAPPRGKRPRDANNYTAHHPSTSRTTHRTLPELAIPAGQALRALGTELHLFTTPARVPLRLQLTAYTLRTRKPRRPPLSYFQKPLFTHLSLVFHPCHACSGLQATKLGTVPRCQNCEPQI